MVKRLTTRKMGYLTRPTGAFGLFALLSVGIARGLLALPIRRFTADASRIRETGHGIRILRVGLIGGRIGSRSGR